jgi:integrase
MPLTVKEVEAAKPSAKGYTIRDRDGLFLFVAHTGVKSWHFRYSFAQKQQRISFGTYPEISLQRARKLTSLARTQVADGTDPSIQRPQRNDDQFDDGTFRLAAERWIKGKQDAGRAGTTLDKIRTYLNKDILPELGQKRVPDITRADCVRVQERFEKRGALNVAKKARGWLREIFSQAIARGQCEYNPASELKVIAKEAPKATPYPHLHEAELPGFLEALDQSSSRSVARVAAWMTILTASRPGMVRYAEWSELDLDEGLWTIASKKMKMRRAHVTPLPTQLIRMLEQLRHLTGRHQYIFPGIGTKNETISENTINLVFSKTGYKGRMVGHGARHTASTLLREHGWNRDYVEMQLSHVEPGVAGDYNHAMYLPQRKAMMQWYADYLGALRDGTASPQAGKFAKRVNVFLRSPMHHTDSP